MRVTESMTFASMQSSIQTAQQRNLDASNVSSSGVRVAKSSDDPGAYAQAMVYQHGLSQLDAMDRASTIASTDLSAADNALSTSENLMDRVKEIAIAGASSTLSASDRATYADEVASIHQSMLDAANTQVNGSYIFSGGLTTTATFSSSGVYQGDSTVRSIDVSTSSSVPANILGSDAYQPAGGVDTFGLLDKLEASLRTGTPSDTQALVGDVDTAQSQIVAARTQEGLSLSRINDATTSRDAVRTQLQQAKSTATAADTSASYLALVQAQQALDGAISTAQKMLSGLDSGLFT